MYKKALYPIHIFQNNIRENNSIQNEIFEKIHYMKSKKKIDLDIPEGWTTYKLYTSFKYEDLNMEMFGDTDALQIYKRYVDKFFDLDVETNIESIWFNYYENGEWQEQHGHTGDCVFSYATPFSCIHFLKYDPEVHPPVVFVDPNDRLRITSIEMESNNYSSRYYPNIREGDIIMFPSYLEHFVPKGPSTPGNPRVTVAFNLKILKYGNTTRDNT